MFGFLLGLFLVWLFVCLVGFFFLIVCLFGFFVGFGFGFVCFFFSEVENLVLKF